MKHMQVKIEKLETHGKGIGYVSNKIIFVPHTLPGEKVEVDMVKDKKNYQVGKCVNVLEASPKRVTPKCPYYGMCGGCDYQHVDYSESVRLKSFLLTELFSHEGLWDETIFVQSSSEPWNYRNKLSMKVQGGRVGFYFSETHQFIEILNCAIANEAINAVLKDFSMFAFQNGDLTIRCNENNEILMDIVTNEEVNVDKNLFLRHKIVGILKNHHVVYGNSFFFERSNGVLYQVSMDSFFQVNPFVSKELFLMVQNECNSARNLLDLYCGVGTIGLQVNIKDVQVTGIEVVQAAILNAIKNATLNHRTNISYHLGKVQDIIAKIPENFDTILVDPPRSGMDELTIATILKIQAEKIIYISCNPNTLIRDLKKLLSDYAITSIQGFDMFPQTKHVECVCVMTRR